MSAPEITIEHANVARQMRAFARRAWFEGTEESLGAIARRVLRSATDPEVTASLSLSRDRMHHASGWWRNAEYEYCWHLSIAAKAPSGDWGDWRDWGAAPYEQVSRDEARYWAHAFFGENVDKLWHEPGGGDPHLDEETRRQHATMWHLRLFLNPLLLDTRGEPHVPFIPEGEVYDLTRWIDGLTPAKVDR